MSTRNALYSGVWMLASPTLGVRVLARCPFLATPTKPQWMGMPTVSTSLPATLRVGMRLVTTALALIWPRLDLTVTLSPFLMPFLAASASEISTNDSGCITAAAWVCLVQKWKCSVSR
jgi:hypothetical protein